MKTSTALVLSLSTLMTDSTLAQSALYRGIKWNNKETGSEQNHFVLLKTYGYSDDSSFEKA